MTKLPTAFLVVTMAIVIIGVDFAFFKQHFWARLSANIIIVMIFGAIWLFFFRRP